MATEPSVPPLGRHLTGAFAIIGAICGGLALFAWFHTATSIDVSYVRPGADAVEVGTDGDRVIYADLDETYAELGCEIVDRQTDEVVRVQPIDGYRFKVDRRRVHAVARFDPGSGDLLVGCAGDVSAIGALPTSWERALPIMVIVVPVLLTLLGAHLLDLVPGRRARRRRAAEA